MRFDLLIRGGRVIDPGLGIDAICDVGFAAGKVAEVAASIVDTEARTVRDASGHLVLPGLIDFHTHVYWGGTALGVAPEPVAIRSGTTTFVDAGSAGPANMAGFVTHVIERTEPRILAFINIAFPGIFAFSHGVMVGECSDIRLLNARECVRVGREFAHVVVGVKVRIGLHAGGASGIAPLDIAIEAADELGLPVMAHIDFPPPGRDEVLERLRPGDVLTHCFRPFPNGPVDGRGRVRDTLRAARDRGVLLDIGHGYGGFAFGPGRAAIEQGLPPDILSSDVHVLSQHGPAFDILDVMSKFWCLGMELGQVVRAVTTAPAAAMRRSELGTLAVGSPGDATIVRIADGAFTYTDAVGEQMNGDRRLVCAGIVIGGQWWNRGPSL